MKASFLNMFFLRIMCFFIGFVIFSILVKCMIDLWYEKQIAFTEGDVFDLLVISGVVGLAAGLQAWGFAKLNDRKARKHHSSDSKT